MRLADLLLPYGNLLPEYYPQKGTAYSYMAPPEYRQELLTINLQQALDGDFDAKSFTAGI